MRSSHTHTNPHPTKTKAATCTVSNQVNQLKQLSGVFDIFKDSNTFSFKSPSIGLSYLQRPRQRTLSRLSFKRWLSAVPAIMWLWGVLTVVTASATAFSWTCQCCVGTNAFWAFLPLFIATCFRMKKSALTDVMRSFQRSAGLGYNRDIRAMSNSCSQLDYIMCVCVCMQLHVNAIVRLTISPCCWGLEVADWLCCGENCDSCCCCCRGLKMRGPVGIWRH